MIQKPIELCRDCPLYKHCKEGYVEHTGTASLGVMLIGEAGGEEEHSSGSAFQGKAGSYLNRVLSRIGIPRSQLWVTNVCACRPPGNRVPTDEEQRNCRPRLDDEIRQSKAKVLVPLGSTALHALTGHREITRFRGYVMPGPFATWVVPTFHPSYLLPRPGQKDTSKFVGVVGLDILKAISIGAKGYGRRDFTVLEDPIPAQFSAFVEEALASTSPYLSVDIETPGRSDEEDSEWSTQIDRIGFAFRDDYAASVPFLPPWIPLIKRLLASEMPKVFWNGNAFDIPIILQNGLPVNGERYDGMWAWHMLQSDLPKKLEFVSSFFCYDMLQPWKHMSQARPAWYNGVDCIAAFRNMVSIGEQLRSNNQWDTFVKHSVRLDPLLFKIGRVNGTFVDEIAQAKLRVELQAKEDAYVEEAQGMVPKEVKPFKLYKRLPKEREFETIYVSGDVKTCSKCGATNVTKTKHLRGNCKDASILQQPGSVPLYKCYDNFNPVSSLQLEAYAKLKGHKLFRNKDGDEGLGKSELSKMFKRYRDPIYKLSLSLREVSKAKGQYIDGFMADASGRIYTYFGHHPSTWRLSSREYNLQNIPHRGDSTFATALRRTIIAPDGMVFVEADSSAIEAVLVGYFMGSERYIRLAKEGIHDAVTCAELGLEFTNESKLRCRSEFKQIRDRNKRVVHGTSYDMGARTLSLAYPDTFANEGEAQIAIDRFLEFVPELPEWQAKVRHLAHKEAHLTSPWGYRHYFYDVYTRDKTTNKLKKGTDAKRAVAFLPQNGAAAFMLDNALDIAQRYPIELIPANYLVHDSYCLVASQKDVDFAANLLQTVLTRAVPELGGLIIGCEIKVGPNLQDMELWK